MTGFVRVVARRLVVLPVIFLLASFLVFSLSEFLPRDPAVAIAGGEQATPERVAEVRAELQLDDPFPKRFGRWLGDAVQLDLGESWFTRGSVTDELGRRIPVTLSLTLAATVVGIIVGLVVGTVSAFRPNSVGDWLGRGFSMFGLAVPGFWVGIVLMVVFAVKLRWLPAVGYAPVADGVGTWLKHLTLPAVALGVPMAAVIARQLRAALLETLTLDYVRALRARGASPAVVFGHALRNASIPVVTVLGVQVGTLLGGTVIVEEVFGLTGVGSYFLAAIRNADVPVIQGVLVWFVLLYVLINLAVDVAYGVLQPRVRLA